MDISNLENLGSGAFSYCENIYFVNLPSTLTEIEAITFY